MNRLVLFDFDGTITTEDSLKKFLLFYHGFTKVFIGLTILSPILIGYLLKIVSNSIAKEILMQWFFKNESISNFNAKCDQFAREEIPKIQRQEAINLINEHKANGDTVAVVTASPENWVIPWCMQLNIQCIGTRLHVCNNDLTGKFEGKNCYGPEKARRIKALFNLKEFSEIIAYGDSLGDKQMFELATRHYYKRFPTNDTVVSR
ncbi:MAG: HAD-IB family hydrolase [Cyclobacteriaceae bacterium]|nr:MAG: HAD-IB family hydrolase [Cyclobacteriaceae bacterium]